MTATLDEILREPTDSGDSDVPPARTNARRVRAAWVAAVVLGQVLVLVDVPVPGLRQLVGAALLIALPLTLLTRSWRTSVGGPLLAFLYATGAVLLSLIVVPLAVNTVLPWLGVARPLGRPVLVLAWTVIDVLLVLRYRPGVPVTRPQAVALLRRLVRARFDPAVTLAAAAVLLAVAGAVRLNNGSSGTVAAVAHAVAIVAVALVTLRRGSLARDTTVLYLSGLALLLGTSLRGWAITGHDIQNEYLAYLYTHDAQHWVMSSYPTPYNACLSVNILPSVVGDYLGTSGLVVFKVLLQLVFALVPVCVYVTARRFVPPRLAALSVLLFVAFPTFYTDMPFLVRQEVAYVFVALVLLTATQGGWGDRRRRVFTYAFAVGVILSHYATTYLLVITLGIGLVGIGLGRWRDRRRASEPTPYAGSHRSQPARLPRPRRALTLLQPLLVVAIAVSAWTWSSPLTHSGNHLAETVNTLTKALFNGQKLSGSSDLKYSVVLGGSGPSDEERFAQYIREVEKERAAAGSTGRYVFDRLSGSVAQPPIYDRQPLPLTAAGRAVQSAGVDVAGANTALRLMCATLIQLALGIGLLALLFGARRTRPISRELYWLVLGSVGALASVVVVPGLSASYGVLRAFQQTLIFSAPIVAIGLLTVLAPLRRVHRNAAPVVATGVGTLVGLTLTGALPAVLGGYDAVLTQSNSGAYYQQLYTADPQLATAQWLAGQTRGKGLVGATASDIVDVTRLQMYLPRSVTVDSQYLPLQLRKGSYLVLGPQTIDEGTAGVFFTGDVLTYRYPTGAVEQRMDVVYSTPGNRVLR